MTGYVRTMPASGGAGRTVHLIGTPPGGSPREIGVGTTDGNGAYSITTDALNHTGIWALEVHADAANEYREGMLPIAGSS